MKRPVEAHRRSQSGGPARSHPTSPGLAKRGPWAPPQAAPVFRCACGGGCPRCAAAGQAAKLEVSRPGDRWEREADRVAEQVMRMPIPLVPATALGETVQRAPAPAPGGGTPAASSGLPDLGPGRPLDAATRDFFEPRLGGDLGHVRVHTGAEAARSARSLEALAYTVGRDIAFAAGRYAPGSAAGRRLLAHELAHVLQQSQAGTAMLHRSCTIPIATGAGADCSGRIDVRAGEISLPNVAFFHLFVVYTDSTGAAYGLRGGPSGAPGGGYGTIDTTCGLYDPFFVDYDERAPSVTVYEGDDACTKAVVMRRHLNEIPGWGISYSPNGPNSNSVVASMLRQAGLPLDKPNVAAPGFDMELTESGATDTPGLGDRRHRLLFMIRGGEDLAALGLDYDIDLFETWGLSFPLIIGADYVFTSGFLASLGLGVEIPLLNLPTTPLAPTHIRLSGGAVAGFEPSTSTDSLDALVGGFVQTNLGVDFSRLRVSPFYRFEHLHNLDTGIGRPAHTGGLQMGLAF